MSARTRSAHTTGQQDLTSTPTTEPDTSQPDQNRKSERRRGDFDVSNVLWKYSIPILLVIVITVATLLRPSFASYRNISAILSLQSLVLIVALAGVLILLVGEFDLSLANNTALVAALTIGLQLKQHLSWPLAILAALGVSVLTGGLNAVLVVKLKVPSFVATLGTYTLLSGIWTWYLNDKVLVPTKPLPAAFTWLGNGKLFGLDVPFYVAIILAIVGFVFLKWLPTGRRLYAVGGNRKAANLSGIRSDRLLISAFLVSGLIAGIAGVLLAAQYGDASPGAGSDLLFPAFAGVFLGATTISPGRYNVPGVVISVYTLAFMIAGLQQLGGVWSETWVSPTFNGAAVIIAVSLSRLAFTYRERRSRKQALARLAA